MNKTKTPTYEKIMIPLRLPPEIYNRMMDEVQKKKKDERGYSVNQYLTDILTKDLDFTNKEFVPVGTAENPFEGIFNGGGHIFSGITIDGYDEALKKSFKKKPRKNSSTST